MRVCVCACAVRRVDEICGLRDEYVMYVMYFLYAMCGLYVRSQLCLPRYTFKQQMSGQAGANALHNLILQSLDTGGHARALSLFLAFSLEHARTHTNTHTNILLVHQRCVCMYIQKYIQIHVI